MAKIIKINHIAIAVPDLENSVTFWQDQLGLSVDHIEEVPSQKSKVAFLPTGDSEVEIVCPTTPDSGMAKYIEKRGPGLHHICFEVDNIDEMLAELKAKGVMLIDETAKELPGRKMAFIHPKSANGVLVELYEVTRS
ncbi:MAG: methylmalonyl-CoA epimerase [Chloroflexi bacterium]|nr:methylmalonyl-CoA epimerase [Chloroflexota bacterium]